MDFVDFVVLDRIEPGWTPPYCTHGQATCIGGCNEWVWLGDQTYDAVQAGTYMPLCKQCASRYVPADMQIAGRIEDHRRADGPHQQKGNTNG